MNLIVSMSNLEWMCTSCSWFTAINSMLNQRELLLPLSLSFWILSLSFLLPLPYLVASLSLRESLSEKGRGYFEIQKLSVHKYTNNCFTETILLVHWSNPWGKGVKWREKEWKVVLLISLPPFMISSPSLIIDPLIYTLPLSLSLSPSFYSYMYLFNHEYSNCNRGKFHPLSPCSLYSFSPLTFLDKDHSLCLTTGIH